MTPPGALLLACERFGIDSPLERAHFFAQVAHESNGFTAVVENLNYSSQGLMRTWPRRFDLITARRCAKQPEKIANIAYADRFGNGSPDSGDGWRYRGRGYIQLTFRGNYQQASMALYGDNRLLDNPDMVCEPQVAALVAGWYWNSRHLSIHARKDDLEGVTRGVNGGLNGLEDRRRWLAKFKAEFGVKP